MLNDIFLLYFFKIKNDLSNNKKIKFNLKKLISQILCIFNKNNIKKKLSLS